MDDAAQPIANNFSSVLPTVSDCIYPLQNSPQSLYSIESQCSGKVFNKVSPAAVSKLVKELSQLMCKYHYLALSLGTTSDGECLRLELAKLRHIVCSSISSCRIQLAEAFKSVESLTKKEIAELERACHVLVGCIHALDREMRRTRHLFQLFPLVPDPDGVKSCHFIRTGLLEKHEPINNNALTLCEKTAAEKYIKERESWQDLEKEILEVHNLDVALHRDVILGPVMDYLTLCPIKGLEDISSSTVSVDDVCVPSDSCGEDAASRRKSNILCYAVAIMTVLFIGSGVLMGVIFIIVK